MATTSPSTPSTVTIPVHAAFDGLFDKFSAHLKDNFQPDEVSASEWKKHYASVANILKIWEDRIESARTAFVAGALKSCFYEARRAEVYVITASSRKAFSILAQAHYDGFLLDIVVADGPSPDVKWESTFTSPVRVSPPGSSLPTPMPSPSVHCPTSYSGGLGHGLPTSRTPAIFGKLSSSSSEDSSGPDALVPTAIPGPAPGSLSGKFLSYAPVCKSKVKVYKLESFLPKFGYQLEDEQEAVIRDGKLKVKSKHPKVSSSHMWITAMTGLGRHLASLPDPGFQWEDFSLYTDLVLGLFATHTLDSVLAFDFEYRKWRRAYGLPWVTDNPYLRTHLLRPKAVTPSYFPESDKARSKEKGFCRDFNKGGCKRSSCRFPHTCAWCSGPHSLLECKSAPSKGQN